MAPKHLNNNMKKKQTPQEPLPELETPGKQIENLKLRIEFLEQQVKELQTQKEVKLIDVYKMNSRDELGQFLNFK
jgi:hypothetical protein